MIGIFFVIAIWWYVWGNDALDSVRLTLRVTRELDRIDRPAWLP